MGRGVRVGGFVVVAVLFSSAVALTVGMAVHILLAPYHVQIAAFSESDGDVETPAPDLPGEPEPESVVWEGGEVVLATTGDPAPPACSFTPMESEGDGLPSAEDVPAASARDGATTTWDGGQMLVVVPDTPDRTAACTVHGADGTDAELPLRQHDGPWAGVFETETHSRPHGGDAYWLGTPSVASPAAVACSTEADLYRGDAIGEWFHLDEVDPKWVTAVVVPIGWLFFTVLAWAVGFTPPASKDGPRAADRTTEDDRA